MKEDLSLFIKVICLFIAIVIVGSFLASVIDGVTEAVYKHGASLSILFWGVIIYYGYQRNKDQSSNEIK